MVKIMKDKIKGIAVLVITALLCSTILYLVLKSVGEI